MGKQTKGQRKGAVVPKPRLNVRQKFVSSKVSGTKGLELANRDMRVGECLRGSVPKNSKTFRIERDY
jgi:hypothetical protein